ncbi:hypothetical protein [Roseicyclus sp.]|uniref:hypothetical protein n=1 Tax=Roseicyclus sp. TaxID=1914329 RepID=UPI003FA12F72
MNRKFGTLVALAAITAHTGGATTALAQNVESLSQQCDYIWDIRSDRSALQRELDLILGGSDQSLTCRIPTRPEEQAVCEEQCVGLILALLGGSPVAELPPSTVVDPY